MQQRAPYEFIWICKKYDYISGMFTIACRLVEGLELGLGIR